MGRMKKLLKSGAAAGAVSGALPAAFMVRNMAQLRLREAGAERLEEAGVVRYPDQVREEEKPRSMEEVMASIRDIPFNPRSYGGVLSTIIFALPDIYPMLLAARSSTSGLLYRYPKPFKRLVVDS